MTRLYLVRHGEPAETARGRCYGSLDVPLSSRGEVQAQGLAAAFAAVPLTAVYTSPRRRALDTAAAIAVTHALDPVPLPALRELDFGELEGRTFDDIAAERPELYRLWMEAPTTVTFPGGEGYADLRARTVAALADLRARHAGASVAVVAHGGVLRAALADALGLGDEAIFRLDQAYGCVDVVDWIDGTPLVRLVNGSAASVGTVPP
jgi:alpha-ribazole phosphatase/probable phosphoglycerate mutase